MERRGQHGGHAKHRIERGRRHLERRPRGRQLAQEVPANGADHQGRGDHPHRQTQANAGTGSHQLRHQDDQQRRPRELAQQRGIHHIVADAHDRPASPTPRRPSRRRPARRGTRRGVWQGARSRATRRRTRLPVRRWHSRPAPPPANPTPSAWRGRPPSKLATWPNVQWPTAFAVTAATSTGTKVATAYSMSTTSSANTTPAMGAFKEHESAAATPQARQDTGVVLRNPQRARQGACPGRAEVYRRAFGAAGKARAKRSAAGEVLDAGIGQWQPRLPLHQVFQHMGHAAPPPSRRHRRQQQADQEGAARAATRRGSPAAIPRSRRRPAAPPAGRRTRWWRKRRRRPSWSRRRRRRPTPIAVAALRHRPSDLGMRRAPGRGGCRDVCGR